MKALKFDSLTKEYDNIDTIPELKQACKEFLENIEAPFEIDNSDIISELEYKSRDGFAAFDHNRGGFDLIMMTSLSNLYGSDEHIKLKIRDSVETRWAELENDIKQDNSEITDGELFDAVYESGSDIYEYYAWRVRLMYEGDGVLMIYAGYDHDAPYFRWNVKVDFEKKIEFKTIKGLKTQLKKLTNKIKRSQ